MNADSFKKIRARLKKTQKEIAYLLGVSIKAIHSYEQGWRKIPHYIEKHLLFLLLRTSKTRTSKKCWDIQKCPEDKMKKCPAWEFKAGDLCWFINGTQCNGTTYVSWEDKMKKCKVCKIFRKLFKKEQKVIINLWMIFL